jgi:uncharacterized protein (DUF433 family)
MSDPFVSIDPAMQFGRPTMNGTRLTVQTLVDYVWHGEELDAIGLDYAVSRADILVACWYAGTYGLPGARPQLFPTPLWRKRWGVWADSVTNALWHVGAVDYDAIPGPPRRAGVDHAGN